MKIHDLGPAFRELTVQWEVKMSKHTRTLNSMPQGGGEMQAALVAQRKGLEPGLGASSLRRSSPHSFPHSAPKPTIIHCASHVSHCTVHSAVTTFFTVKHNV